MMPMGRAWEAVTIARDALKGQSRPAYFPASNRILIAIQFWQGDRDAAMKLARFLADLEPRHTSWADILLISRFDCMAADEETVRHVSRKFNVFTAVSPVIQTGWPKGCNGLWSATMQWVRKNIEAKTTPDYKAVFTCEADGGPCIRNWIEEMSTKWDEANRLRPTYVAGPMVEAVHIHKHINGNCLVSCEPHFLKWVVTVAGNLPEDGGWDYVLFDYFEKWGCVNLHRMRSYYNSKTFTPDQYAQMREEKLIWVHGIDRKSVV